MIDIEEISEKGEYHLHLDQFNFNRFSGISRFNLVYVFIRTRFNYEHEQNRYSYVYDKRDAGYKYSIQDSKRFYLILLLKGSI